MNFNDINYKPSLDPNVEYWSDIKILTNNNDDDLDNKTQNKEENIYEKLNDTLNLIVLLPDSSQQKIIEDSIELIKSTLEEIDSIKNIPDTPEPDNPELEKPEPIVPESNIPELEKPEPIISDLDFPFMLPVIENIIIEENDFEYDTFIEILNDYLNNLQNIVTNYINGIEYYLVYANTKYAPKLKEYYNKNTEELPDDLKHIGDEIIKSQIIKNQKNRLFTKVSDVDNLAMPLNQFVLNNIKYERYNKINHMKENNIMNVHSNKELDRLLKDVERQNKNCLYNLYRQLNASNLLLEDCIEMQIREMQLKIILLKEGCL